MFALCVTTALIPVSLRLGRRVVRLKYWRIVVLMLNKKKANKETQLLKNNGTYSATFTVIILHRARNIHYRCFSWNSQLTFIVSTSTCLSTTPTKSHPHKFNYCDLFFVMPSALAKFIEVKFTQSITVQIRFYGLRSVAVKAATATTVSHVYLMSTLHVTPVINVPVCLPLQWGEPGNKATVKIYWALIIQSFAGWLRDLIAE